MSSGSTGKSQAAEWLSFGRKVVAIEKEALRRLQTRLDGSFGRAVALMIEAVHGRGKIICTGVGKSGLIGQKVAATLSSTGAPSVVLNSVDAVHGDLGVIVEGDVVLAFSYSGETEELVRILPFLRRLQARLIAISGRPHSTLASQADVYLDVSVTQEACPLNLAPTSSTTAMLAMGDALAMTLLHARGFTKEDFARFHPGGSLGRRLLDRVGDVMRPLDQVVVLAEGASVSDALAGWAAKRTGAAVVIDARGRMSGIFTHGDFVRKYQADPGIGKRSLATVMTRNPISVRVDKLAVEVLNLFQQHRIDDLVVIDRQRRPVGLVDAQDIAKQRLM
jgi:arabinose-5-phosphate isomerase